MKPLLHSMVAVCVLLAGAGHVKAAGVAALKAQPYHRDSVATSVTYSRIIDSRGPYLRIVSGRTNVEILRSNLVDRIEIPEKLSESIAEENDIAPLRRVLEEVKSFRARYPSSAAALAQAADAMEDSIRRFDSGEVRFEGVWMTKTALAGIQDTRRRAFQSGEREEVEKRLFEASQRDEGRVLHDGRWMTPHEIEHLPAEATTELSECLAPMANGDLQAAKFAVKNLTDLAVRQTGAPKVRTERLRAALKNLFTAEFRLSQRMLTRVSEERAATNHDQNAKKWLLPNAFGSINVDSSRISSERAAGIRQQSMDQLGACKQELIDELHETDRLLGDFYKLREHRVALLLAGTIRSVAARHLTIDEFQSTFPREALVSARERILRYEESRNKP